MLITVLVLTISMWAMWSDPALLEPVMTSKIPDIVVHEHSTVVGFSCQEFARPISCAGHVK